MNEKLRDYLANVPCVGEDAYNELYGIVDNVLKTRRITYPEKARLYYELDIVKRSGAAKLFLFALNALKGFSADEYCFLAKENDCFINHFLRLTSVNPVEYGLQFELFFNPEREDFPKFCFYVKNGTKERLLNNICGYYETAKLITGKDNGCRYFVDTVGKTKSGIEIDGNNRAAGDIKVATLSADELAKSGLFEFDVFEYERNEVLCRKFSDEEIYDAAIKTVAYKPAIISMKPFDKIVDVTRILSRTCGRLIFQEQVVEILSDVCGYNPAVADRIRKSICTKKTDYDGDIAVILRCKYGIAGEEFFKYLAEYGPYTVSESYVIAKIKNDIVWEKK